MQLFRPEAPVQVAVVDDNPADLILMQRMLELVEEVPIEYHGFDSVQALERALLEQELHLVFVDNLLGAERGVDAIGRLSPKYSNSAFVLLTGQGGEDIAVSAMRSGAADYLIKDNVTPESLGKTISQTLSRQFDERQFEVLVDVLSDAVLITGSDGAIEEFNVSACRIFDIGPETFENENFLNFIIAKADADPSANFLSQLESASVRRFGTVMEILARRGDGSEFPAEMNLTQTSVLGVMRYLLIIRDISQRKLLESELVRQAAIIEATPDFVAFYAHDGRVEYINPSGRQLVEIPESSDLQSIQPRGDLEQDFCHSISGQVLSQLHRQHFWSGESRLVKRKSGDEIPVSVVATTVADDNGVVAGYAAVIRDITREFQTRDRLQQLADNDALTGLANRKLLLEQLDRTLALAVRHKTKLAVLFIDLDHFKGVNDTYGHEAGDELLKLISRILLSNTRKSDMVARMGGDEFVILMEDLKNADDCLVIANKIREQLSQPLNLLGNQVFVTPSVGIATFPECGRTGTELLQAADIAMYQAKFDGRNRYHVYSEDLHRRVVAEETSKNALNTAVENDELVLHYQPVIGPDGSVDGFEGLMRWQRGKTLVYPGDFIEIAERSGLISKLGEWALREGIETCARWRHDYGFQGYIAINVSVKQLKDDAIVEQVRDLLQQHRLDGRHLVLEMTETMLVADMHALLGTFEHLRELNVGLAIDDFGTGYASFRHLKMMPFSILKIDKLFIDDTPDNVEAVQTVESMIELANTLELKVVCEGVETGVQSDWLSTHPNVRQQGWYHYKAMSADEAVKLLQ